MRVKLLIAMALASVFLLAGVGPSVAGTGPFVPICDVTCIVPPSCPPCTFVPAVCSPGVVTPCTIQLAQCPAPEPCIVKCTCPTLTGSIALTSPGGINFVAPNFECPSAAGPTFIGPTFQCPIIFDP
jgi:hypothetical protein